MDEEEKDVKVKDRRLFNEKGELRKDISEEGVGKEPKAESKKADQSTSPEEEIPEKETRQRTPLPPVNFTSFVLSLSTNALMHMGEIPNPLNDKEEKDIEAARHTIDIIAMLQKKTTGNLHKEEKLFVEEILYNLRMKFVALAGK